MRSSAFAAAACVVLGLGIMACGDDEEGADSTEQEANKADSAPPPQTSTTDAGPSGPKVECQIGAALEEEPNDSEGTATPFRELSLCGVLETAKDVDYLTFETPAGTKLSVFQAVITGNVDFQLTLDGKSFGPADTDQFGSGRYLVKVFTKGQAGTYRLRVQFD